MFTSLSTLAPSSGKTGLMWHPVATSNPAKTVSWGTICRYQWVQLKWESSIWRGEVWIIKLNGGLFNCIAIFFSISLSMLPRSSACMNENTKGFRNLANSAIKVHRNTFSQRVSCPISSKWTIYCLNYYDYQRLPRSHKEAFWKYLHVLVH